MKYFFSLIFLLLFLSVSAQTKYALVATPMCWDSAGTFIPVTKVARYEVGNGTERVIGYFHASKRYATAATSAKVGISLARCERDSINQEWYSSYLPFTASDTPAVFVDTIPFNTRDITIYNVTASPVLVEWEGSTVGNGFYIPPNGVLELPNATRSLSDAGAMIGDLTFTYLESVGSGIPHMIINYRVY